MQEPDVKTILIRNFQSLDNYGTGMMGLITFARMVRELGQPLCFRSDFAPDTDLAEIQAELGLGPDMALLERGAAGRGGGIAGAATGCALALVLGGDSISEYYRPKLWRTMLGFQRWALSVPVVLLGQTIGPFDRPANRLAAGTLLRSTRIVARDRWTTDYLRGEFGLGPRLTQGTDLAFADLPLQHRADIEAEVLARFGLARDGYVTLVISALQKSGYYTSDRALYLKRWGEIVAGLAALPELEGKRIVLLAHTFSQTFGDEATLVRELFASLPEALKARVVAIPDRILQTRARFVLGNGLLTVTGRMHAAVSTFQMGKPAVSLSYSKKYAGVIGTMLGRGDLILEANAPALWEEGAIVGLTLDKVREALARHDALCAEIRTAVSAQKATLDGVFADLAALVTAR
jgi:colanic acid/amylovoran biosynthesis protein